MNVVVWIIVAIVIIGIVIAALGWDRYRGGRKTASSANVEPTDEVFTDPTTGKRTRVWSNPATGEREYRAE